MGVLGTGTTQKGGLRHGHNPKKGGPRQEPKRGGLRHGSGQKRGVSTAAHTCTGHIYICECPRDVVHEHVLTVGAL